MARKKLTEEEKKILEDIKETQRLKTVFDGELKRRTDFKENFENPTRTFNVGYKWTENYEETSLTYEIVESYDGGLFYRVNVNGTTLSYGKVVPHTQTRVMSWLDIEKENAIQRTENFSSDRRHILSFYNSNIQSLLWRHYMSGIDYDAFYQRDYVWQQEDKEYLIDSIFKSIDIGKFVLLSKEYGKKNHYEILDGKQKLLTLVAFYEDRFRYNGYLLSELSARDKNYFLDFSVSISDTQRATMSNADKKELFIRLNTAGKSMSKEHLDRVQNLTITD